MVKAFSFSLILPLFLCGAAYADEFDPQRVSCGSQLDPASEETACSRLIESGILQSDELLWAYNNRAVARARLGRFHEAENDLSEALLLNPDFAPAHYTRGEVHLTKGAFEEALSDFDKALEAARKRRPNGETLTNYNPGMGELVEVTSEDFQLAARLSRTSALVSLGRLDEAERESLRALALAPDDARVHNNLGYIHLKQGEFKKSVQSYERAVALEPKNNMARAGLKAAREASGQ